MVRAAFVLEARTWPAFLLWFFLRLAPAALPFSKVFRLMLLNSRYVLFRPAPMLSAIHPDLL
jgi:hypothetical protein